MSVFRGFKLNQTNSSRCLSLVFLLTLLLVALFHSYRSGKRAGKFISFNGPEFLTANETPDSHKITTSTEIPSSQKKVLVMYPYAEKESKYQYQRSLKYFIELGVDEMSNIDYLFIIQGGNISVALPNYTNVHVFKRPNDCYDFGAYGAVIEHLGGIEAIAKYSYFIFVLPSAVGPILPKYWPESSHWTQVFISRLKDNVHACGTTIICLPPGDVRSKWGPHIQGMAFGATLEAVQVAWATGSVFSCHQNKENAIFHGELGFSRALLNNSMNLDTLLLMYANVNWLDKKNWNCNDNRYPVFKGKYGEDMTIHPL
jgi:hypothetical protein